MSAVGKTDCLGAATAVGGVPQEAGSIVAARSAPAPDKGVCYYHSRLKMPLQGICRLPMRGAPVRWFAGVVLALGTTASIQAQNLDIIGEWQVVRPPSNGAPSSAFSAWLRSLPMAVYMITPSNTPPLAMIHNNLGFIYFPSLPTLTILDGGIGDRPRVLGFLQRQVGRRFEGELVSSTGCWTHLSLDESEDGSKLSGSARINTKLSTRECRSALAKEVRKGQPFSYALMRLN